jgi:hypothetical protein
MQAAAEQDPGLTNEQWIESQDAAFARLFASAATPTGADGMLAQDALFGTTLREGLSR